MPLQDIEWLKLRLNADQKARLLRAARLRNTDVTDFVVRVALREADVVIEEAEQRNLSKRDHARIMELLENPPTPNGRLRAAGAALPKSI